MEDQVFQKLHNLARQASQTDDFKEFCRIVRELVGDALDWEFVEEFSNEGIGSMFSSLFPEIPTEALEKIPKHKSQGLIKAQEGFRKMIENNDYDEMMHIILTMTLTQIVFMSESFSFWHRLMFRFWPRSIDRLTKKIFKSLEYQEQIGALLCLFQLADGKISQKLPHLSEYFRNRYFALALAFRDVIVEPFYNEEEEKGEQDGAK